MGKKLILTVCSGNIHRSVIAQLCLSRELARVGRHSEFNVLSRGIQGTMGTKFPEHANLRQYSMEYSCTEPCLQEIGIEIPFDQKATLVDEKIIRESSLVLAMDEDVLRYKRTPQGSLMSLVGQFPKHASKMHLFMELVNKKESVHDCGGVSCTDFHRRVVMSINETARLGVYNMIRLAEKFGTNKE